jgi:DNA transformation protein
VRERRQDLARLVKELLAPITGLSMPGWFGGIGLRYGTTQFGMIMDGTLYFVVDAATRQRYEAAGSACFTYATEKGRVKLGRYFAVPAQALEDPDQLVELARESIIVASRPRKTRIRNARMAPRS